ncbi:MAG: exodeoxyribonuclease VII small subunit [Syntrophales bacterium]
MAKENFEEALKKLEEIIKKMESGELPLEESLKAFEEGIKLTRFCEKKLDEAQRRVEILTRESGGMVPQPFEEE